VSKESRDKLDALLQQVTPSRRKLLKRLLIGGGVLALAPTSMLLAQTDGDQERRPGKGRHKGWRKANTRTGVKARGSAKGKRNKKER
jgi:hypothetical protein